MQSAPLNMHNLHIRWMIGRDLPEVMEIEPICFGYHWRKEEYVQCLLQENCRGLVAQYGEKVVGFAIYELGENTGYILDLAVHPAWRRLKIGTQIVARVIDKLEYQFCNCITVELRETNLTAQLFFRQQQFRAIGVLRRFYEDSGEDAFQMEHRFGDDPCNNYCQGADRIAKYERNS